MNSITDSTTIVRATLRLTPVPVAFGGSTDTVTIYAHPVSASPLVTDLRHAAMIVGSSGVGAFDSLFVSPGDTASVRTFELYGLVRVWGTENSLIAPPPRAVVLRSASESTWPTEIRFYGTNAAPALRPSMRISYVPRVTFGVP